MKLSLVTIVLLLIVFSGATVQGKETVSGNSSVVSLTTGKAQGQILMVYMSIRVFHTPTQTVSCPLNLSAHGMAYGLLQNTDTYVRRLPCR